MKYRVGDHIQVLEYNSGPRTHSVPKLLSRIHIITDVKDNVVDVVVDGITFTLFLDEGDVVERVYERQDVTDGKGKVIGYIENSRFILTDEETIEKVIKGEIK